MDDYKNKILKKYIFDSVEESPKNVETELQKPLNTSKISNRNGVVGVNSHIYFFFQNQIWISLLIILLFIGFLFF